MDSRRVPLVLLSLLVAACGDAPAPAPDAGVTHLAGEGRFSPAPDAPPSQREMIERLQAIGYEQGVLPASEPGGVRVLDRERAWPGVALYVSGHAPEALLVDLRGEVLHRWQVSLDEVWPGYRVTGQKHHARFFLRRAHVFENGDLLAIFEGYGIVKLDRSSNILWAKPNRAHHDLEVLEDGRIVTLTRTAHVLPRIDPEAPRLEDFVVVLDPNGHELQRVSLLEALERSPWADEVGRVDPRLPERIREKARAGDLFHTNAVEIVRADHPTVGWMRKGRALVSLRFLSALMAVDLERERVVWLHRGDFVGQHEPRILADGRILLFDNGNHRGRSRALELDPADGRVLWQYPDEDGAPLFSQCCSTAARLPNGNSLVVVTDMGLAREVTPAGEVVWEFASPHRAGEAGELVAALFDLVRLPADFPLAWTGESLAAR